MALVVSDFFESLPKVSSNHFFSDSSYGLLHSFRTARRSSAEPPRISSSMVYRAAIRSSASFANGDLCASYNSKNGRRTCDIHPSFLHSSTFINPAVPGVGIRLQRAHELTQVSLRMFIPRVGPQAPCFGFATA